MSVLIDLIRAIVKRRPARAGRTSAAKATLNVLPAKAEAQPARLVESARRHAADGRAAEAIEECRAALALAPDFSAASILLAVLLRQALNLDDAIDVLVRARAADPSDPEVLAWLRRMIGSGRVPMWHFSMMNDAPRNSSYEAAIRAVVRSGDNVLEIGTGSGLLSMMASRAGATHVTTCEMVEPIAEKARTIIARNGFARSITVISKESSALELSRDLAQLADVLVAEVIASDLLGEGMLDSYDDARARLLKPGARVVPCAAAVRAQLAGSPSLDRFLRVGPVAGFDLQDFNDFTPVSIYPDELGIQIEAFSAPFQVFDFDLQSGPRIDPARKLISVPVTASGTCQGVLQWIWLQLAPGVEFENGPVDGPDQQSGHWRQVLHTFPVPLRLVAGQTVHLVAAHDRNSLMFWLAR